MKLGHSYGEARNTQEAANCKNSFFHVELYRCTKKIQNKMICFLENVQNPLPRFSSGSRRRSMMLIAKEATIRCCILQTLGPIFLFAAEDIALIRSRIFAKKNVCVL